MPESPDDRSTRPFAVLAIAAHLALLAGLFTHRADWLSFDTLFRPERGATLHFLADGFRGAVAGRGFYASAPPAPPGTRFGPFDPMAERATPAQIALVGAPFAALPRSLRFPVWILLNEAVLLVACAFLLRRVRGRGRAIALGAALGAGTPLFVALAAGSPVTLAAAALLLATGSDGRGRAALFGAAVLLRPFLALASLQALRARQGRLVLATMLALAATLALFPIHAGDLQAFLTRHPYGESYPGNLGLQALLFSTFRDFVPTRRIAIELPGRTIYDLNILSLIVQRAIAFALIGLAAILSLRGREPARIAAAGTLWACTWILAGVEVKEGDFLLVIAGAAAMAVRGTPGRRLPAAALWIALPSPLVLLPVAGFQDWSPEFGWSALQTLAQHTWRIPPVLIVYWIAARECASSKPNHSG